MVAAIVIGLMLIVFFHLCGFFAYRVISLFVHNQVEPPTFRQAWLAGLCIVIGLASMLSLFMRLQIEACCIFLGLILSGVLIFRKALAQHWKTLLRQKQEWQPLVLILGIICFLIILEISVQRSTNPDSGIYHAQAIRWIENYAAVPGLANLHTRFGYNSSWLVINALTSFVWSELRSFHFLPAILYGIFLSDLLAGICRWQRSAPRTADYFRLMLLPISLYSLGNSFSSPATDFPTTLLLWIIFLEFSDWMEEDYAPSSFRTLLIPLLVATAVTIKLTAAPLLLFAIFVFVILIKQKRRAALIAVLSLAGLVVLPWLARNMVLSGYLIFPEASIDIFNFDWKTPHSVAVAEKETIQSWARLPRMDAAYVQALPFSQWIRLWYRDQTPNRILMLWLIPAFPAAFLAITPFFKKKACAVWLRVKKTGYSWLFALSGLVFWLLNAPDFRFGIGWVVFCLVLALYPWFLFFESILLKKRTLLSSALIFFIAIYACSMLVLSFKTETLTENWLLPADYIKLTYSACEFRNFSISCADAYGECWYEPFPCVVNGNLSVEMRGVDYQQGFRWLIE